MKPCQPGLLHYHKNNFYPLDIKNLLSVHKISKSYGIQTLYKDITFGIHEGEKVAIVAKNGAGKTTLIRTLMDPATADTGEVVFRNGVR